MRRTLLAAVAIVAADPVDFAVVGLDHVEPAMGGEHRVEGPVGLEVVGLGMGDRMGLHERAEVRDQRPRATGPDAEDAVRDGRHAVRAAGAGEQAIQRAVQERDVRDAAHEGARGGGRLAGRQAGHDRRDHAGRRDPGDPPAADRIVRAAGVGPDGRDDLGALRRRR
jgi:hypothetical protein